MAEIMPVEACTSTGCRMQARVAIRTTRPQRDNLVHAVYMDNRTAPKTAARYCATHGARLMTDLVGMADVDALMPGVVDA